MRAKAYWLIGLVMVLALSMACGGGGSSGTTSSGGGGTLSGSSTSGTGTTTSSVVGTWLLVSSNYDGSSGFLGFNANGTGSFSGGSLNWSQQGDLITATSILFTASISISGNTLYFSDSNGVKATYNRA
jgi:hypothetical protein